MMAMLGQSYVIAYSIPMVSADGIICRISKQYVDTRTQANLSKLNAANHLQDLNIVTEHMSQLLERRRRLGELILHVLSPDELIAFYILMCQKYVNLLFCQQKCLKD